MHIKQNDFLEAVMAINNNHLCVFDKTIYFILKTFHDKQWKYCKMKTRTFLNMFKSKNSANMHNSSYLPYFWRTYEVSIAFTMLY